MASLLTKTASTLSQSVYLEALKTVKDLKSRLRLPQVSEDNIKIHWVSSDIEILGNKQADLEAKRGALTPYP